MKCDNCKEKTETIVINEEIYFQCVKCKYIHIDGNEALNRASYGCGLLVGLATLAIVIIKNLIFL